MPSRYDQRSESSQSGARSTASASSVPNDNPKNSPHATGNSNKVLPILIMLDVSPSMHDEGRIEEQNIALATFLKAISRIDKVRKVAQISFCLFTKGVKYKTAFMPLTDLQFPPSPYLTGVHPLICQYSENGKIKEYVINLPQFTALKNDGTDIPDALNSALDMMQGYVRSLPTNKQQHYVPFLVFTSDGNPDLSDYYDPDERIDYIQRTQQASQRMNNVCRKDCSIENMIIPFFIGIGNAKEDYLRSFCREFQEGVQLAKQAGEQLTKDGEYLTFSNIAKQIAQAIAKSITLSESSGKLLDQLSAIIINLRDVYD